MFFVSLLLNETLAWTRAQSGTTSLRAILYMDEIFGYFPPVANPPSKLPLLTLLKQARAFGVGVVLATQNPVDLDYKGLSNTGTWFIGRLQTERDKARLLDGLEGAAAGQGSRFDRGKMEETIAGLGNRIFLMSNVHDDAPRVFETRWAMSYLRGPLTRSQISTLMAGALPSRLARPRLRPRRTCRGACPDPHPLQLRAPPQSARVHSCLPTSRSTFVPVRGSTPAGATLIYQPMLCGVAEVRLPTPRRASTRRPRRCSSRRSRTRPSLSIGIGPSRSGSRRATWSPSPAASAGFAALPAVASKAKSYDELAEGVRRLALPHPSARGLDEPPAQGVSQPGETEADFRARLAHAGREKRDQALDVLRRKIRAEDRGAPGEDPPRRAVRGA